MTRVDLEAVERMLDEATEPPEDAPIEEHYARLAALQRIDDAAPTLIRALIEEIERLRMLVAELMDSNDMACETPASACDCSGCSYAREESERV